MAIDLYVDTTSHTLLSSDASLSPLPALSFYFGDTVNLNLGFLKETGKTNSPLSPVDLTGVPVTVSVGTLATGAVISSSLWNDNLPITATISSVSNGSSTTNSVQSMTFNAVPNSGTFALTLPATTGTFTTSANATSFTTSTNHGLVVGQTIALSWSSFLIPAFSTSVPYSGTFYVNSTPTPTTFTVATTTPGNDISPAATLGIFSNSTTGQTATVVGLTANTFTTSAAHGFSVGDIISFQQSGIFTGLTAGTTYYVQAVPTSLTFTLAATSGGAMLTGISFSFTGNYSCAAQTTTNILATSGAAGIQSALSALSGIKSGNVLVAGNSPQFSISFVNALANVAIPLLQITSSFISTPYKSGSLSLAGTALKTLVSNSSSQIILEISSTIDGSTQTLAQYPVTILPALSQGTSANASIFNTATNSTYLTPPLTLGADYAFGVLPINKSDGSYLDLTGCYLTATMYDSQGGNEVEVLSVSMPSQLGLPIICKLPASQTSLITIGGPTTWWLKLLLTTADGSVLPMGNGPVQVIP